MYLTLCQFCYKSTDILHPHGIPECTKKLQNFLLTFWKFSKKDSPAIKYKSTLPLKTVIYVLYTDSASLLCSEKLSWLFFLNFVFICLFFNWRPGLIGRNWQAIVAYENCGGKNSLIIQC